MKIFLSGIAILLIFNYSTCSPLYINYYSGNDTVIDSSNNRYLNNGEQQLFYSLTQAHYPGGSLRNSINIRLANHSQDSLFISPSEAISFSGNKNLIDSIQFKNLSARRDIVSIFPGEKKELGQGYLSSTFKGSFKKYVKSAHEDSLKLIIRYYTSNNQKIADTINLFPDLSRFR